MKINVYYLAGRCVNGAERDGGTLYHGIPEGQYKALCGAKPGRRSAGWMEFIPWREHQTQDVNCPRCLKKMNAQKAAA